jgi:hypothetical protein
MCVAFLSDQLIVVAGCGAKKVWVFSVADEAGGGNGQGALLGLINRLTRPATAARRTRIKLAKFIASNDGISHLSLHSGGFSQGPAKETKQVLQNVTSHNVKSLNVTVT